MTASRRVPPACAPCCLTWTSFSRCTTSPASSTSRAPSTARASAAARRPDSRLQRRQEPERVLALDRAQFLRLEKRGKAPNFLVAGAEREVGSEENVRGRGDLHQR